MTRPDRNLRDEQMDQILGNLLRTGVILAATVVIGGGVIFLTHHGKEVPELKVFRGEPLSVRIVPDIFHSAIALQGRGLIQLGILLLILTPVARVLFSFLAFTKQGDRTYMLVTLIVLGVLLHSLLSAL